MILSVIIPTFKRNDLLIKCLKGLAPNTQTIKSERYEVIVTDDSLNCEARPLVESEFPWVKWTEGPHKGPAANRNHGSRYAQGQWLVFIDDDCIPNKEILTQYYNYILLGNYDAFEGLITADRPQQRFDEESPLNLSGGCFWSCNIAVKKEIFQKLNGFDEGFPFPAMEDIDFHDRLRIIAKTKFLKSAKVVHPWRQMKPFQSYRKHIYSQLYLTAKNNKPKNFAYRFAKFNLFVGSSIKGFIKLSSYGFRGKRFFVEMCYLRFLMIFK